MGLRKGFVFVDYYLALILIGSQLWSSSVCEQLPGYKIDTSRSVTVQRGLCVHVPCSFTVPRDKKLSISTTGIWYHLYNGTEYIAASKNHSVHETNGRFFMTGNVSSGDCSYSIEGPGTKQKGQYYFRFEDEGPMKFSYKDIQPYVNITDLTDKPNISSTRLVDGKQVTLTCTSPGRCRNKKLQITWEGPMTGIRQEKYDVTYGDGSRTFHSNITFTPRKSHNNSTLFCNMTFKGVSTVEEITLNVEYSPSVIITVKGADTDDITTVNVKDGDSITMKCIVDSDPKASITWYKEDTTGQRTISDRTVTLTLRNITLSDAGRYQCSAENEHGAAHRTVEIIYNSTGLQFRAMIAMVVGIFLLVLIIVIGAFLFMGFKKKRQEHIKRTLNDMNMKDTDAICCNTECTIPKCNSPQETVRKDLQSSGGGGSKNVNLDDVHYASITFSRVKPKEDVSEKMETEYSEIKRTQ